MNSDESSCGIVGARAGEERFGKTTEWLSEKERRRLTGNLRRQTVTKNRETHVRFSQLHFFELDSTRIQVTQYAAWLKCSIVCLRIKSGMTHLVRY